MREAVIYHKLKAKLRGTFIRRIENSLEIGTPDMYFCNERHSGWIESKQFKLPVRDTTPVHVPFRQGQYNWLIEHYTRGGLSILAIHTGDRTGYYFATGKHIQKSYTLEDFQKARETPNKQVGKLMFLDHEHFSVLI